MTPVSIVESLLEGLGGVGAITYKTPEFLCHCSDERVYTALKLLEKSEVRSLLAHLLLLLLRKTKSLLFSRLLWFCVYGPATE